MPIVLSETDADGVVTITLNDPETRNAISGLPMIEALLAALDAAEADPKSRVIVLTGNGSAFSSGGNIKAMSPGQGLVDDLPAQTRRNYKTGIQRLPLAMEALELPVIAAVNGPAIGAGFDLTLMCDIRIAGSMPHHAEIRVSMAGYTVSDLGGGVRINGVAIEQHLLRHDDVLEIGPARFTFREG